MEVRYCIRCGGGMTPRALKAGEPERHVCDGCGFIFYLDPKVAAGVIVRCEGGVLLLRRAIEPSYGRWVFPGGFVDRGEHPRDAAAREAWEEAGIEVAVRELLGVYHEPPGSPVVLIVYRAELIAGTPMARDESLGFGLFAPEAIPWEDLAFPTTRAALRDYVAQTPPP
jgi:ADP-ribose pyrophosphatase YjhB (NUDIX family)